MKTQFVFIILSVILERFVKGHGHECNHHEHNPSNFLPKDFHKQQRQDKRNLQVTKPQPIRITLDFSNLDNIANGQITEPQKDYLKRIMKSVQLFYQNTLYVNPRTTNIIKYFQGDCLQITPPSSLYTEGVANSDLHILVSYVNNSNFTYIASAGWCEINGNPYLGRIQFNLGRMTKMYTTNEVFEDYYEIALHETTHVLGFSGWGMQYWIDPETGSYYLDNVSKITLKKTVFGVDNVIVLKSKNVLQTARDYYKCDSLEGLPMENQGGSGSFGSHWERDLVADEIMTSTNILGKGVFSAFTAALLLDTGYFVDVNLNMIENSSQWGRGKGCNFVSKSCTNTEEKYPEFYYTGQPTRSCDFYNTGCGPVSTTDSFSQCAKMATYSNYYCNDLNKAQQDDPIQRMISGTTSKCFESTVIDLNYSGGQLQRCHKFQCPSDSSYVDVIFNNAGDEVVRCTTPNQAIDLSKMPSLNQKLKGILNCPRDFFIFCQTPKYCKNSCSSNGFCNNGKCYCLDGFAGEDCSIQCEFPKVWDGTSCIQQCPVGTFSNPDKTCKSTCYPGFYPDSSDMKCKQCNFKCNSCFGPEINQCTACNSPYKINGSTCGDIASFTCHSTCLTCSGININQCLTCPKQSYLSSSNECILCSPECNGCNSNPSMCTECINQIDYKYDALTKKCSMVCHSSCTTCTTPNNDSTCLSCPNQFYLSNGKCLQCISPCQNCISESVCLSCISGNDYIYDQVNKKCNMKCDSTCKTCNSPNNPNDCLNCYDGFFLNSNKQCQLCVSPCDKCLSLKECLSCKPVENYVYNQINKTCTIKCDVSCKTCNSPNNPSDCTSCNDGYFQNSQKQCQQCQSPCDKCISMTECLSCNPLQNYNYDQENKKCIIKCDPSCKTCNSANNASDCSTCIDGFFLNSLKQCQQCVSPCGTCLNQTECLTCDSIQNYNYDSTTKKCTLKCDSTCKSCNSANNSNDCSSCNDGFFLNEVKQCQQCVSPCSTCLNQTECLSCQSVENYTYDQITRKCNMKCDSSCLTCNSPNNQNACTTCITGKYLNQQQQQCLDCSPQCGECQNEPSFCLNCKSNIEFIFDPLNNTCLIKCDQSCSTCSQPNNPNSCLKCKSGYFLLNGQCLPCKSPCKNCQNSESQCLDCIDQQYIYNPQNYSCIAQCDASCKTCSVFNSPNNCTSCEKGYYLKYSQCYKCVSPCEECLTQTYCDTCGVGYTLSIDTPGKCVLKCDSSCRLCDKVGDQIRCSSCKKGYVLINYQCQQCTSPCSECSNLNTSYCTNCVTGYSVDLKTHTCLPICHVSCLTCSLPNNSNACTSCGTKSYLYQNQCKECLSGTYLSGNQCLSCMANCSSCKSSTLCLKCNDGYKINIKGQCQKK